MSHQPSKSNKWELIKKAQERFDNRFPPIAIGYDGSVDDDKKRQAHRDFMSTEVQIAIEAKDAETKKAVEKAKEETVKEMNDLFVQWLQDNIGNLAKEALNKALTPPEASKENPS